MVRALRAWAINQGGKNSVRNLRYGPRTRLVRGIYTMMAKPVKTLQAIVLCNDPVVIITRGGGYSPKKMGRGVRPASQNTYPIYE